jgi:hypothetical protein
MKQQGIKTSVDETFATDLAADHVEVPLSLFYGSPAMATTHPSYAALLVGAETTRTKAKFKGDISLPVGANGEILPAVDLLRHAVSAKGVPYPYKHWDHETIVEFRDTLDKIIDSKTAYFELCIGDGETTKFLFSNLKHRPGAFSYGDIVADNIVRADKVVGKRNGRAVVGDILQDECWERIESWKKSQMKRGMQRFVLGMFGVTFNDFSHADQRVLLERFGKIADHALVSCDHTTDPKLLYKYYYHPKMDDLFRVALTWNYPDFRPAAAEFGIRVDTSEPQTARETSEVRFVMRDRDRVYFSEPILKRSITELFIMAKQAKVTFGEQLVCKSAQARRQGDVITVINREHAIWDFRPDTEPLPPLNRYRMGRRRFAL